LINLILAGEHFTLIGSVVDDPSLFCMDPDPYPDLDPLPSTRKKVRKTLLSTILWVLIDFLSKKTA
jgi:hypothetical protein